MKKLEEVFTQEQLQAVENTFVISGSGIHPIGKINALTEFNLKIIGMVEDEQLGVLGAEDFELDCEQDFVVYVNEVDFVFAYRSCIPKEVVDILDAAIKKREK